MVREKSVYDCCIIRLPKVLDFRGNLTFVEQQRHIPFDIARAYWIYDVPGGESRGGHAFRVQEECIISLSGSFDVVLEDGVAQKVINMSRAYNGLYVPNMIWRTMRNFSTNAVALVLASLAYDEDDYIRDFDSFVESRSP